MRCTSNKQFPHRWPRTRLDWYGERGIGSIGAACNRYQRIHGLSGEIEELAKRDAGCERLMTVPGIGPIISSAMVAAIGTGDGFVKGRDFAAWLGLVPRQISTGDRTILGKLSKRGNRYLRILFVQAAWVVLVKVKPNRWGAMGSNVGSRAPRNGCITMCWQSRLPTNSRASRGAFLLVDATSRQSGFTLRDRSRPVAIEVCERTRRDGGSVFPAHANTGDPFGPVEACPLI